jgi:hypothetical protein
MDVPDRQFQGLSLRKRTTLGDLGGVHKTRGRKDVEMCERVPSGGHLTYSSQDLGSGVKVEDVPRVSLASFRILGNEPVECCIGIVVASPKSFTFLWIDNWYTRCKHEKSNSIRELSHDLLGFARRGWS